MGKIINRIHYTPVIMDKKFIKDGEDFDGRWLINDDNIKDFHFFCVSNGLDKNKIPIIKEMSASFTLVDGSRWYCDINPNLSDEERILQAEEKYLSGRLIKFPSTHEIRQQNLSKNESKGWSLFKHRVSYRYYPTLKLHDFFIFGFFYFSHSADYGYWWRINIFGKWRHFKLLST